MEKDQKPILWNSNFIQCCISYFLMSFAFYMLMPTMPVYLTEELGIAPSKVGLALSSYTLGLLCVRPFSGYLVDSFSRKVLYLLSFSIFTFLFMGYFFTDTVTLVMLVRFIQGGFMGLASVSGNTITIDVIPSKRRGEGMGFYGVTLNLSMCLSPVVAVYIYEHAGFHPLIGSALSIGFLGVLSVLLIRYTPPKQHRTPTPFSLDRFILIKALPSAFSYILSAIPYGMIVSFVILYGKEAAVPHPAWFFIFMASGVGVSRMISGKLIDKGKVHTVSVIALIGLSFSLLLFALYPYGIWFHLSALFIGCGFGISIPAYQYIFVNVATPERRGTATSTYLTSFDVGVGSGTLLAGYIASHFNLQTAFLIGSFFGFMALIIYITISKPAYEKNKITLENEPYI